MKIEELLDRLEPDIDATDLTTTATASIAISLKRIADALDRLPHDLVNLAEQAKIRF